MPLEFVGDAISLSGLTGTKLKCEVIGSYYPFWWKITSGGKKGDYGRATAIVELNAATGEDYIKDTKEAVLGSAGHALELKIHHLGEDEIDTSNLKVVLIEDDAECYKRLRKVIRRRWPAISVEEAEGPIETNSSNVYLLNRSLDDALLAIENIRIGNAIYYFDPLRSVHWATLEKVANDRITKVFQTGTEFIIFLFTSDWFLGRDEFAPLPKTIEEKKWSTDERETVGEADALFGSSKWHKYVLNTHSIDLRQKFFVSIYKLVLLRWFRYVLAMPFAPKKNQLFHVILCSNFEDGVKATREFYASRTDNPRYLPGREPGDQAYKNFRNVHPGLAMGLTGKQRPLAWRILWKTIKYHEGGVCDFLCRDFAELRADAESLTFALDWLYSEDYLKPLNVENAWRCPLIRYRVNWQTIKAKLGVDPPPELKPISPEEFSKFQWRKMLESLRPEGEKGA